MKPSQYPMSTRVRFLTQEKTNPDGVSDAVYDEIFNADRSPEPVPWDLENFYLEVSRSLFFLAPYPRYSFVCPCCNVIFPNGSKRHSIFSFRQHIHNYLHNGGGCGFRPKQTIATKMPSGNRI